MDFARELIAWYEKDKRDLPWRKTSDPYIIWLSEVIMQQTRVDQGMPYFNRFAETYPTVADLANSAEDEVLRLWQGLGYYSRGRNLHHTAKVVMEEYEGYFPTSYDDLLGLKGIGEYTAAAISSFSANEPRAVVDGNVFRLLARVFGVDTPINTSAGKKLFTGMANQLMDRQQAGLYNQAAMEFGSLICRPRNPKCHICPLRPECSAYNSGRIHQLPVKKKSAPQRRRYFHYMVVVRDQEILMNKRGAGDIWQNLYELPMLETGGPADAEIISRLAVEVFGPGAAITLIHGQVKHVLSHQKIDAAFYEVVNLPEQFSPPDGWFYVKLTELDRLAKPKLIFQFLRSFFLH